MSLPSKKITGIILACALVVFGTVYLKNNEKLDGSGNLKTVKNNTSAPPLKTKDFYKQNISTSTSSLTDGMSRDFFLNFVDLHNKGDWNVDSQAALIENLSTKYATTTPPIIGVADISVFSDRDTVKTRAFGNAVAKTMAKYQDALKTSPFDILNSAINIQISSSTFQQSLTSISQNYSLLSKDLSKIPAPATFTATYADIINTYFAVGVDVNNMRSYWSDPVRGFLGITNYQKDLVHQMDLLKSAADYFKTNAIIFSNTEDGKIWTNISQIQ